MLKKDITYEGFEGEEVIETHYFHIYEDEFVEFQIIHELEGGLEGMFKKLQEADDRPAILELFKELICMGYGERDPEKQEKFRKTPEITADFRSGPAFHALYKELMTSENAAAEFLLGAIPRSLSSNPKISAAMTATVSSPTPIEDVNLPDDSMAWPKDNGPQPPDEASHLTNPRGDDGNLLPWAFREPTAIELAAMPRPYMMDAFRRKNTDWQPFHIKS